jgi:PEP-CTERM motif
LSQVVQLTASGASSVSVDASLNVSTVPEPSTTALTFLGLALVTGLARRRRSLHGVN